jgi:hypothetical protein
MMQPIVLTTKRPKFFHCDDVPRQTVSSAMGNR